MEFSREQRALLIRTIAVFGNEAQCKKAAEECAELIAELLRPHGSISNLVEEIADATIMLKQLHIIVGEHFVEAKVEEKLARLEVTVEKKIAEMPDTEVGRVWKKRLFVCPYDEQQCEYPRCVTAGSAGFDRECYGRAIHKMIEEE